MADIKYSDVISHLLQALPDIREFYNKKFAALHAENNRHVIYGSIFVEYINHLMEELKGSNRGIVEQRLRDAFGLIEELSTSSDFETLCLVEASVLEGLLGEKGGIEQHSPFMGSATKRLARKVAERWGLDMSFLS